MSRFPTFLVLAAGLALSPPAAIAHEGHVHATHDVAAAGAPQIIEFRIDRNPAGGWDVVLVTANFAFVPDDATAPAAEPVGHAHLFINGADLAMIYAPTHHIDALPFGPHDLRVVLCTREHEEYAIAGRPIEARLSLTVE